MKQNSRPGIVVITKELLWTSAASVLGVAAVNHLFALGEYDNRVYKGSYCNSVYH